MFDYYKHVYRLEDRESSQPGGTPQKYRDWRTYKVSDHLPMWIELKTDFGDDYLATCGTPEG